MSPLKIMIALPFIVLAVIIAKVAQYAAVDAFGERLGFDLASLIGLAPVICFYFWLNVKFPKLTRYGLSRGRP